MPKDEKEPTTRDKPAVITEDKAEVFVAPEIKFRTASENASLTERTPLDVVDPEIEKLFVAPNSGTNTKVAALLAKCVIPVSMGIIEVPDKILKRLEGRGRNAEEMLPERAVEVHKKVVLFKEEISRSVGISTNDLITFYYHYAMQNISNEERSMTTKFITAISELCNEVATVEAQYASQASFHLSQTLGQIAIDPNLISTPLQNTIIKLNRLASGFGGYWIIALVKIIHEIRMLLTDKAVRQLYGAPNMVGMLNKLGYRIMPDMMLLHTQLQTLMDIVMEFASNTAGMEPKKVIELILVCKNVKTNIGTALKR